MKTAYLDCFSGVSGDMLLGALVDTGLSASFLHHTVSNLKLPGCSLAIERITEKGLAATRVSVLLEEHGHSHHHHTHRHLADIEQLLAQASLAPVIRDRALAVFHRLAQAEAAVHGTTIDTIHFHEVGAVDALIDIVGAVAGFAELGIDYLVCSPLPMPRGWVSCEHGQLPLPAPAVCALLQGVPVYGEPLDQELVTPTGAALVAELASEFGHMPPMLPERIGYGAGSRERRDGRPNLLRLMLGQGVEAAEAQTVTVIETHLDDWNPEFWPYVSNQLMAAGALDVALIPIQMKKGRPGFLLRVVCDQAAQSALTTVLFTETSTLGLRLRREQRITLPREAVLVSTPWGELAAKKITTPAGTVITPEYEVCRQISLAHSIPLQAVYAAVSSHPYTQKSES